MIISYLLQPVHTDKYLEAECGVGIRSLSKYEIGLIVHGRILELIQFYHPVVIRRRNGSELIHIEGGQISVVRPLGKLGIVELHQHGRQGACGCQQSIIGHNIVTGDRNEFHGDVPLIAEVLLNPLGPVVAGHIRNAFHTSVINRNLQGYILCEGFPAVHSAAFRSCRLGGCRFRCGCGLRRAFCRTFCRGFGGSGTLGCAAASAACKRTKSHHCSDCKRKRFLKRSLLHKKSSFKFCYSLLEPEGRFSLPANYRKNGIFESPSKGISPSPRRS